MSIETDLKKEGIEIIKPLDTLKINLIASKVANLLIDNLPDLNLNYQKLFIKLSRLNMYIAKMPEGTAKAKYFYKNSSIYFDENIDFNKINNSILHECIHCIQEFRDNKNNLLRLGLCDFLDTKLSGMGLNEAAVQLLTTSCLKFSKQEEKYYGISLRTTSPDYYPLECNLISQMAYITGINVLFDSTLFSNDNFKNSFIEKTSKKTFIKVQKNIDDIIYAEDELSTLYCKLENVLEVDNNFVKATNKITSLKEKITAKYIETQNLIMTSYFETSFEKLSTPKQIESYRNQLYNYKNFIGVTDNYNFYNDFYIDKMVKLEQKYLEINNISNISLVPVKNSMIKTLLLKLKQLIGLETETMTIENK